MNISRSVVAGLALALGLAGVSPVSVAAPQSAVDRPAIMSAKASRSLLLDLAQAGSRLVVVGDRGHILFSDDQGKSWVQAKVPVSVMLTSVYFANAQEGWAVGHNGVILYSSDAGASWQLQHADKDANSEKAGAPLLGVWFADNQNGFAVGAYGYFLATHDGGSTWSDNSSAISNTDGWHLNAIRGQQGGNTVFIVGEHGTLFRSQDKGASWQTLHAPFDGSFFGISPIAPDMVLLYGLQGRLFASSDQGGSWRQLQTGVTSGLNAATRLGNGHVVVAGNAGVVLSASDNGLNFITETRSDRQSITALWPLQDGGFLTAGDGGVKVLPAAAAGK
ncbi:MAG TPA: YCF48-related protein [Moraxellaceae bacterium]